MQAGFPFFPTTSRLHPPKCDILSSMGKVHRIKRKFAKLVAQEPWKTLKPNDFKYYGRFYVGVRWNGSHYIGHHGQSYNPLLNKLEEAYEAGDRPCR